ncbi:hypothetical protein GCM10028805_38610 [Spirosoma harenae]
MKTIAQLPVSTSDFTGHVTYQIDGFDRLNFVSDIMSIVPEEEDCTIRAISFEVSGWRASGRLTIQMREKNRQKSGLMSKLRAIRGVVRVLEIVS